MPHERDCKVQEAIAKNMKFMRTNAPGFGIISAANSRIVAFDASVDKRQSENRVERLDRATRKAHPGWEGGVTVRLYRNGRTSRCCRLSIPSTKLSENHRSKTLYLPTSKPRKHLYRLPSTIKGNDNGFL